MSIAQDDSGFIWVGTQGGLARFDGYEYRNFLPDPSDPAALPDGYVRALLGDAGGMWIGTSTNGLAYFDERTERFRTWHSDPTGRTGPHSGEVNALLRTADGALWIGGDGGLDRLAHRDGAFESVHWPSHGNVPVVWALARDRAGTIWIGAQDGLYELPPGSRRVRRSIVPGQLPVYSVYEDEGGRLWAGSVSKLWELDRSRRHARALVSVPANPRTLAAGQQWSLIEPQRGVLWAGTDNAISSIDLRTGAIRRIAADDADPSALAPGRVEAFLRDRSGLIWIADHIGGLLLDNPHSRGLDHLSSTRPDIGPPMSGGALAVAVTPRGTLWTGGLDGRLSELDPRGGRARAIRLPTRAAIQALLPEPSGALWIGTTNGLCRLAPGAADAQCPAGPAVGTESIYSLLDDGRRLWIGGSNGLFIASRSGLTHIGHGDGPRALPNDQVRALLLDRRGRMWIGTEDGLDVYERSGRIVHLSYDPRHPERLGPGGITTLAQDRSGRIWAGANGGPLDVITDSNGVMAIRHLGIADGMPHENVDGLAEDGRGTMWAATDKGIAQIDERSLHVRAYGVADGVSEAGFWAGAVAQARDGSIFFGGLDGVTVVEPDAGSSWTYAPPVVVTALYAGRRSVPAGPVNLDGSAVSLPKNSRNVTIDFAALDYSAPQALRYRYRLRGYDREWVDTDASARTATYTHLPPGTYTFELRATNRLGVWNARPLLVSFSAAPWFYESWWFRVLLAIAAAIAIAMLSRLRTRLLRHQKRELETIVESRTRELSAANLKLQELSVNDPLTGLRNRRFVSEHLESEASITLRRYDAALASGAPAPFDADILFFLIDLDNFKAVNDAYGHTAGDALLVAVCEVLHEHFRGSDFVARWGGDEFLAIARGSRREDAHEIAERLRAAVAARTFSIAESCSVEQTVSIGFSAFPFDPKAPHAATWSQVLALADQALYQAKHAGRNTWRGISSAGMRAPGYDLGESRRSSAP